MSKSEKFLKRALAKLTRFRENELYGELTYQEIASVREFLNIKEEDFSWPPKDYVFSKIKNGEMGVTSGYFKVEREVAEKYPFNKYYLGGRI